MNTLAYWHGGPGPWILFVPLVWILVIGGIILLLRRTVWRGRGGPPGPGPGYDEPGGPRPARRETPLDLLDRRFAAGEIDEDEYRRRFSVLSGGSHRDGGG